MEGSLGMVLMVDPVVVLVAVLLGVAVGDIMAVTGMAIMVVMIRAMMITMVVVVMVVVTEKIMVATTMMIITTNALLSLVEVALLEVGVVVHVVVQVEVGTREEVVTEVEEEEHPVVAVEGAGLWDVGDQEVEVLPQARGSTVPTRCKHLLSILSQSAGSWVRTREADGEASQLLSSLCMIIADMGANQTKSGTATVTASSGSQENKNLVYGQF